MSYHSGSSQRYIGQNAPNTVISFNSNQRGNSSFQNSQSNYRNQVNTERQINYQNQTNTHE